MMSSSTPNSMLGRREARVAATTANSLPSPVLRGKVIVRGSVLAIRKLASARRASAGGGGLLQSFLHADATASQKTE